MKKFKICLISLLIFNFALAAEIPPNDDDSEAETKTEAPKEEEEEGATFKGHKLIEATPMTADDLEFLRTLDETVPEDVLDFWATPVKTEEAVPILVHPELLAQVEEVFQVSIYRLLCAANGRADLVLT